MASFDQLKELFMNQEEKDGKRREKEKEEEERKRKEDKEEVKELIKSQMTSIKVDIMEIKAKQNVIENKVVETETEMLKKYDNLANKLGNLEKKIRLLKKGRHRKRQKKRIVARYLWKSIQRAVAGRPPNQLPRPVQHSSQWAASRQPPPCRPDGNPQGEAAKPNQLSGAWKEEEVNIGQITQPTQPVFSVGLVVLQNKQELKAFLEPQQIASTEAGAAKLLMSVRTMIEMNREWVVLKGLRDIVQNKSSRIK